MLRWLFKPMQPVAHTIELFVVDPIDARAASLLVGKEPGLFENAEVPAGCRPGATEAAGDLACSHAASAEPDYQKNVAPCGM